MFLLIFFILALLLNLIWEFLHWRLYETAIHMEQRERRKLLITMSVKDTLWILLFYYMALLFGGAWGRGTVQTLFIIFAIIFAFVDELISLRTHRWTYSGKMPTILGVGLSPLLELAVTGTIASTIAIVV